MKSPDQYQQTEVIRLLLQGPPGSGKDVVAAQFPKPFVIDIDRNLGNVMRFLKSKGKPLPLFDFIDTDAAGAALPMPKRYARLNELLIEGQTSPDVETIVISSGTTLSDVMIAAVLASQGKSAISDFKDGRQFWNFFAVASRNFMATLSQVKKNVVLTVHEKVRENEQGQTVYPIEVAWPGQTGDILGCFFTNVWRCETESVTAGTSSITKYFVRTAPNHQHKLKQALVGIPDRFEFNWDTIQKLIK